MPQLDLLPSASSPFLTLLSWLLTYTLHSTLLGAGAWLVTGLIRGHALRATLWKAALLGGLLTTGMQMGLQVQPWGGRLALPAAWASPHNDDGRESFPAAMVLPGSTPAPAAEKTPASGVHTPPPAQSASAPANSLQQPSRATQGIAPLQALSWGHLLVAAWLTGAAFFLVRLLAAHRRFLHGLGTRTPVKDASLRDALQRLRRRSGHPRPVRLTQSDHLTSPGPE